MTNKRFFPILLSLLLPLVPSVLPAQEVGRWQARQISGLTTMLPSMATKWTQVIFSLDTATGLVHAMTNKTAAQVESPPIAPSATTISRFQFLDERHDPGHENKNVHFFLLDTTNRDVYGCGVALNEAAQLTKVTCRKEN